jgi:hypothetical protein
VRGGFHTSAAATAGNGNEAFLKQTFSSVKPGLARDFSVTGHRGAAETGSKRGGRRRLLENTALPSIIAYNFKPIHKGTLIGSADLLVTKRRFNFYGALWHRKGDREWIFLLAREWARADCKHGFSALGKFSTPGDARRFSTLAIEAIKRIAEVEP